MKSVSINVFFRTTPNPNDNTALEWMESASMEHLLESISTFSHNIKLKEHAKALLQIRIAQQAADSANKIIQHSEKLSTLTEKHIQHAQKLTMQTDELLKESVSLTKLTKQLRFWTIALGLFAVVQIVIMLFDYLKHK